MYHFFMHHTLIQGDYKLSQIQIQQQLGRGNSHVFTAVIDSQLYALKQIQIKDDFQYKSFLQQIKFMRQLSQQSECMVKYNGYFITKMQIDQYQRHKYAFIIMECAQMNLQQLVVQCRETDKRFTIGNIQQFIQTILIALCQLEDKHIAHCDIKPENILIMNSTTYELKLCDVGSCKVVTDDNMGEATILGTVPFLAPQLIKIKSKKITSNNPFKSDVFSFGLVVLYLVTFKKFKSQQRLQVEQLTYKEIIYQWIKEAKELVNFQFIICEILKMSLDFDENKRPMFQDIWLFFNQEKKKKLENKQKEIEDLERQQEDKLYGSKIDQSSSCYTSVSGNYINMFKSRKVQKSSNKTSTHGGTSFRISTTTMFNSKAKSSNRNLSPPLHSSFIKKRTLASTTSPGKKFNPNYAAIPQFKKIVYINEKTKQQLQKMKEILCEQQKTFALQIPFVPFKEADTIAILPECGLQVVYMLSQVRANRLYLEYEKVESVGLPGDAPMLNFPKIRVNLACSSLAEGYSGLFSCLCNSQLQILQLRITESQVTYTQVMQLLDNLQSYCPKLNSFLLSWQKNILSPQQHLQVTQKVSRLPLKRLFMIMNQNYIKYDKQMPWLLPKQCQVLYLQYGHNLLNSIINNLSLSISALPNLKELYLNFQNNNLMKGEINMISKSISQLKQLQKIILDISLNNIDDLNYLEKNLSEHINLQVIELRLHRTETSVERSVEFIRNLKELFQFKLKILKVSVNRIMSLKALKDKIEPMCVEKGVKKIICDVIGFDNSYFMIYLKKKPRIFTRAGHKTGSTSVRKDKLQPPIIKYSNTISMSMATTLSTYSHPHAFKSHHTPPIQLPSPKPITGLCTRLYTTQQTYDNYMCLGCCQSKQTSKNTFYCKFCIEHCLHKGHNIVKVYSRTRCSCSHSGQCQSDCGQNICAERLKIAYKKKFDCLKCDMSYCVACVGVCKDFHKEFVKENNQLTLFACAGNKHKMLVEA